MDRLQNSTRRKVAVLLMRFKRKVDRLQNSTRRKVAVLLMRFRNRILRNRQVVVSVAVLLMRFCSMIYQMAQLPDIRCRSPYEIHIELFFHKLTR